MVIENVNNGKHGGNKIKKTYFMKPKVFKKCLMRCKSSDVYANYFLQLEDVFVYYQDYEKEYLNNLLSGKDDKFDKFANEAKERERKADEERKEAKERESKADEERKEAKERDRINNEKIDNLLKLANLTLEDLDETKQQLDDINGKMDDVIDTLKDTCDLVSIPSDNPKERSEFILIQNKDNLNEFKFIRGIKETNEIRIKKLFNGNYNVIKREYDANPITLFKTIKSHVNYENRLLKKSIHKRGMLLSSKEQAFDKIKKIQIKCNDIVLSNGFELNDLYALIENIANNKFTSWNSVVKGN